MTQATINGHTYSDDGSSARDMLRYGYSDWLIPMLGDVVTVAGEVAGHAAQTAIDAASAADVAGSTRATSSTSLVVEAGTKNLVIQAGKQFGGGDYVTISRTSSPSTKMHGTVTSYSGTALEAEVSISTGSGTYTDWTIALSGPQGATGATGDGSISYLAKTGAYTITAADKAKVIDCSGTFTISFQACATLGAAWLTHIRNSGAGVITLDPNSSETIEGASTYTLYPGAALQVQCDGSSLRVVGAYQYAPTQFFHARDEKANGTAGGTSSAGLNVRFLNAVIANTIPGSSLASNVVTLPPGKYYAAGTAPFYDSGGGCQAILQNVTDGVSLIAGESTYGNNTGGAARVSGTFTLAAQKNIALHYYAAGATADNGLGLPASRGFTEVFSDLQIWRML